MDLGHAGALDKVVQLAEGGVLGQGLEAQEETIIARMARLAGKLWKGQADLEIIEEELEFLLEQLPVEVVLQLQ